MEQGRRNFFVRAIYGLGAAIGAALGIPAAGYLLLPPKAKQDDEWVEAGDVSKIEPGSAVEMVFRRNRVDGWKVLSEKSTAWVVKTSDDKLIAFAPQCTHLGCAYHWDAPKKEFLCPCHTSTFAIDGKVTAGPAPRALDRYDVKVEGNKLLVGRIRESEPGV